MRNTIKFFVNDRLIELQSIDINMTVLQYLRSKLKLTATKEGCAEGDCGACSVVLIQEKNSYLEYKAINSCLLFLPMLDGKQLITVEGLASYKKELHPVQKSVAECHGTQCGFCTPGIISSLFAYYKTNSEYDLKEVKNSLVGNLCRCTGYRPILEAAKEAFLSSGTGFFDEKTEARILNRLKELKSESESLAIEFLDKKFFSPKNLVELLELKDRYKNAYILAGGTDLGLLVTKRHQELKEIISLENVIELKSIKNQENSLLIGSALTYEDIMPTLKTEFSAFYQMLLRLASKQIRNIATIAGNLVNASPIGDCAPLLLALDAELTLLAKDSQRKVKLHDFFLDYRKTILAENEVLAFIEIPKLKANINFKSYKISKRFDQDISTLSAAFYLELENTRVRNIRIAYGGMAATPKRALKLEQFLIGSEWNEKVINLAIKELVNDFSPLSDFRGSSEYRSLVAGNLLKKFYLETLGAENLEVYTYGA